MTKVGDRIKIVYMKDDEHYNDREGIIEFIDSKNQLHGTWGSLAVIPEVDTYKVIGRVNDDT
ncbi:DUF4314 domain-containing protein [Liberiplasma polymorphum]|uniref:DUF4314 domain-containing protein n=1 Tax=Liberiplasma polymorphum TaxID=3374570 RepID=UPI00377651E0